MSLFIGDVFRHRQNGRFIVLVELVEPGVFRLSGSGVVKILRHQELLRDYEIQPELRGCEACYGDTCSWRPDSDGDMERIDCSRCRGRGYVRRLL